MEHTAPNINVTPLIDVLLVLLIIFMVIAPQQPHRFKASLPDNKPPTIDKPNPLSLVVTITPGQELRLNQQGPFGPVSDAAPLTAKLYDIFRERTEFRVFSNKLSRSTDLPDAERAERTVFLKAPRAMPYGAVAKVMDSIKSAGAEPIGLQLDALE